MPVRSLSKKGNRTNSLAESLLAYILYHALHSSQLLLHPHYPPNAVMLHHQERERSQTEQGQQALKLWRCAALS